MYWVPPNKNKVNKRKIYFFGINRCNKHWFDAINIRHGKNRKYKHDKN